MKKRRVLKKWIENLLILINMIVFTMLASVIEIKLSILIILLTIFIVNNVIIAKYGKLFKD